MDNIKYIIFVNLPRIQLKFQAQEYEIIENTLLRFYDEKKHKFRTFDSRICEIEEVER